ncbi:helix-turn-helix transcriptional regulator [Nonomuraea sp. NPDC002799]
MTALNDSSISTALTAIHHDPAHPWTVETLATQAGLSRAAFARKFTTLIGQPPLTYLTWWRMTTSARLQRETNAPLRIIATQAGYSSEIAFAAAFKRQYGLTPGRYRQHPSVPQSEANGFPAIPYPGSGDGMNGSVLYPPCDGCAGRKIVAVSWRSGASHEYGANRLARVTFVDVTSGAARAPYRHVLLVEPDGSAEGFREVASHADGISWYGNKLFLVTGGDPDVFGGDRLVRVFDLTHIWKMNSTASRLPPTAARSTSIT